MRLRKRIVSGKVELYSYRTKRLHRFSQEGNGEMVFVSFSIQENPNSSGVTDKHHRLSNEPLLLLNTPLLPQDSDAYQSIGD